MCSYIGLLFFLIVFSVKSLKYLGQTFLYFLLMDNFSNVSVNVWICYIITRSTYKTKRLGFLLAQAGKRLKIILNDAPPFELIVVLF